MNRQTRAPWRKKPNAHSTSSVTGETKLKTEKDERNESSKPFETKENGPAKAKETKPLKPAQGAFAGLLPCLQRAISNAGYTDPTAVQEQAIPALLAGRDLLASAPTGTGKTAAFTLPILDHLVQAKSRPIPRRPRALILAPTRELAAQIGDSVRTYGKFTKIAHVVIHGGVSYGPQVSKLSRGAEILVATPGRLLDLMQSKSVYLDRVNIFTLDEVDRMLDMGFIHDIKKVIAALPPKRQTLCLSATLPGEVRSLVKDLVNDPKLISVAPKEPTVEKIAQRVLFVEKNNKDALLASLLKDPAFRRVIVFTKMKCTANKVTKRLIEKGVSAEAIHGNKTQGARTRALEGFKKGKVRVLVATDVAARGIDVDKITHVINFDMPTEPETYVHRIGRTARAGLEGEAISFCSGMERRELRDIERTIRKTVPVDKNHPFHSERRQRANSAPASRSGHKPFRGGSSPWENSGPKHSGGSKSQNHSGGGSKSHRPKKRKFRPAKSK